jgi:hypothetical protein
VTVDRSLFSVCERPTVNNWVRSRPKRYLAVVGGRNVTEREFPHMVSLSITFNLLLFVLCLFLCICSSFLSFCPALPFLSLFLPSFLPSCLPSLFYSCVSYPTLKSRGEQRFPIRQLSVQSWSIDRLNLLRSWQRLPSFRRHSTFNWSTSAHFRPSLLIHDCLLLAFSPDPRFLTSRLLSWSTIPYFRPSLLIHDSLLSAFSPDPRFLTSGLLSWSTIAYFWPPLLLIIH